MVTEEGSKIGIRRKTTNLLNKESDMTFVVIRQANVSYHIVRLQFNPFLTTQPNIYRPVKVSLNNFSIIVKYSGSVREL